MIITIDNWEETFIMFLEVLALAVKNHEHKKEKQLFGVVFSVYDFHGIVTISWGS
jgi:hypothetical protein